MSLHAVLAGPTASGKTALALRWAQERGLEIISADSRQIYRGFRVGTGQPTAAELRAAPHHLLDFLDPAEPFSPKRFRAAAESIVRENPGRDFLVVGGTGLYLKEWMRGSTVDRGETPPEIRDAAARELEDKGLAAVHAELSRNDPEGMRGVAEQDGYRIQKRLENWSLTGRSYAELRDAETPNPLFENVPFLWLNPDRADLHARIERRIRTMIADGWPDEVRDLLKTFDPETTPAFNAVGYREIAEVVAGNLNLEAAVQKILSRTRQYAKRQTTFFKHQFLGGRAFAPEALARELESVGWRAGGLTGGIAL